MRAHTASELPAPGRLFELDWLMLSVCVLSCLGLTMAVSIQSVDPMVETDASEVLRKQGVKLCAGLIGFLVAVSLPLDRLRPDPGRAAGAGPVGRVDPAALVFLAFLALTLSTLVVGTPSHGAYRWLKLGSQSIQPVDFARLAMVVLVAARLADEPDLRGFPGPFVRLLGPPTLLAGALILQPDNGNALLVMTLASAMVLAAGVRMLWFGVIVLPVVLAGAAYAAQHRYVLDRIGGWLAGEPHDQVKAGLLAMESGGVLGVGLGSGWMKLGFVPEAQNDFVFTIVGEELGLVGTAAVVLMFAVLLASGVALTRRIEDTFYRYVVFGCTVAIALQACANLAVTTGLVPPKGIDLPFVSSGGSNLVACLTAVGLIGNAARRGAVQ